MEFMTQRIEQKKWQFNCLKTSISVICLILFTIVLLACESTEITKSELIESIPHNLSGNNNPENDCIQESADLFNSRIAEMTDGSYIEYSDISLDKLCLQYPQFSGEWRLTEIYGYSRILVGEREAFDYLISEGIGKMVSFNNKTVNVFGTEYLLDEEHSHSVYLNMFHLWITFAYLDVVNALPISTNEDELYLTIELLLKKAQGQFDTDPKLSDDIQITMCLCEKGLLIQIDEVSFFAEKTA